MLSVGIAVLTRIAVVEDVDVSEVGDVVALDSTDGERRRIHAAMHETLTNKVFNSIENAHFTVYYLTSLLVKYQLLFGRCLQPMR